MYQYVLKRVLLTIPTLIGAAALVFLLMRLIPGDICLIRLGGGGSSFDPKALAACHSEIGVDRPMIVQFFSFIWGTMRLDFGTSMWSGKPVITEIAARLPISLEIAILATVVAISIAIPLGTISALKQNSWLDIAVRVFAIGGIATPSFWIGILWDLKQNGVLDMAVGVFAFGGIARQSLGFGIFSIMVVRDINNDFFSHP